MLGWLYGVKKKDKIRDEHGRGFENVVGPTIVVKKIAEKRLKW